jgi:siroheme decarboxylase
MTIDKLNKKIINHLQYGFPLVSRPFQQVAIKLGIGEGELIKRIKKMLAEKILTRFGPLYNAEKLGGCLSLCAMSVPDDVFAKTCDIVNGFDEVAHNYQRDHNLNMWFVIACQSEEKKLNVLQKIEKKTAIKVYDMPKEKEFFVGFFVDL